MWEHPPTHPLVKTPTIRLCANLIHRKNRMSLLLCIFYLCGPGKNVLGLAHLQQPTSTLPTFTCSLFWPAPQSEIDLRLIPILTLQYVSIRWSASGLEHGQENSTRQHVRAERFQQNLHGRCLWAGEAFSAGSIPRPRGERVVYLGIKIYRQQPCRTAGLLELWPNPALSSAKADIPSAG